MSRILIRAHKSPFKVADAETTLAHNLIGSNTGNLVFSQAVYRLLSTDDQDLGTSGIARSQPAEINEQYDRVVIPLANAFRPGYLDTLEALSRVIERLSVPVTVLGVGAQADLSGTGRNPDAVAEATCRFVSVVLDRSPSIGVRGEFTRTYLRTLGFGDEHVQIIGCPSMFSWGPDLDVRKRVDALTPESAIALNVSPYVKAMGPISVDHAERYPNLVYLAQNHRTLELMLSGRYPYGSKQLAALTKAKAPVSLDHPLIRQNRVRFFLDPQTWFTHLAGYDFSFGTRIHGNIAALLAGTPALVLAHDSRTLELASYHSIPHRVLAGSGDRVDAAELYAEADWEPLLKNHRDRWDTFAAFLAAHQLDHVYAEGQSAQRFDTQMAATTFPPPVETLMGAGPEQLYAMRTELDSVKAELRTARKRLRAQSSAAVSSSAASSLPERLARRSGRVLRRTALKLAGAAVEVRKSVR